jgi:hypothetical protein
MDRVQVKQIKQLIKLMHDSGVTNLKVGDIELTIPHPKPGIKTQIMSISPQEIAAASQSAYGNHRQAMEIMDKKPAFTKQTELDELDSILFFHEEFSK